MPTVRFDAWVNALQFEADSGHLVMLDEQGGFYYELAMGEQITDPEHPYFNHQQMYTDVRDGRDKPAKTKHIVLKKSRKEAYYREQLMKMRKDAVFRFTHLFYVRAETTEEEYSWLMATTLTRGLCGAYNFAGEAQEVDMLLARCVSPLEFLARIRDVQLAPGTALNLITQFSNHFHCPVLQEQL